TVLPALTVVSPLSWHGLAHARNVGTDAARGSLIAYCDADDVVSPEWLAGLTSALEEHGLATGPVDLALLNPPETYRWRTSTGWERLPDWHRFLPAALGCNLAVRRGVFTRLGGFDVEANFGDDFDFVWRAQLDGAKLGFVPSAVVHYRLRSRPVEYFSSHVRYGRSEAHHYARFSSEGMPRRLGAGLLRLALLLPSCPLLLFRSQRYRWLAGAGISVGRLAGSYHNRVLYL
ncbi:MAG: glycosyltransferase, partial [Acidimicrobiales bacterium]